MASHDVMLAGGTSFRQRFVNFHGRWIYVDVVLAKARELQASAVVAKVLGDRPLSLKLYKALKPYLQVIDEHDLCGLPVGLQLQVLQHTIDQLEANG